jgi:hypothetical protein
MIKKSILWGGLLAGLALWGVSQGLSSKHICWKEGRRLTDREVLDRYLFGTDAPPMSEAQKIKAAEKKGYVYPSCCTLYGAVGGTYSLTAQTFRTEEDGSLFYTEEDVDANPCGQINEVLRQSATNKDYEAALDANRKFWEEQE